jgi:hypothetical protein
MLLSPTALLNCKSINCYGLSTKVNARGGDGAQASTEASGKLKCQVQAGNASAPQIFIAVGNEYMNQKNNYGHRREDISASTL